MKRIAIIGGGISGLAALHFIRTRYGDACLPVLYEKETRLGGTIGTDVVDGFISDWGPNGFLDRVPLTLQMVRELGAEHLLEPSHSASGKRFIYRRGRLHEITPSPVAFMRSPLLSIRGRLRLAAEPFIKGRRNWDEDESIFDFATRRIGREAALTLIDPMVSGIFGGNAARLSLQSCFPIMRDMEMEYGSLVKALIARKRKAHKTGHGNSVGPAGPAGRLTSFKNGLYTLIRVFGEKYAADVRSGRPIGGITRTQGRYYLDGADDDNEGYDAIICAAPAYAASTMTRSLDVQLSEILAAIPYASIAVVCLGYRREEVGHDLNGFGFIIPRTESRRILGTIWTSSIFAGSAPEGTIQVRTMVGGATDPEAAGLADETLVDLVAAELKPILEIRGLPVYVRIFKYQQGIPQFTLGHAGRMKTLADILTAFPGLYFTGNAYDGVGLNDCVLRSDKAVSQTAAYLEL